MKLMIRQEKGDFIIGDCLIEVTTGASYIGRVYTYCRLLHSIVLVFYTKSILFRKSKPFVKRTEVHFNINYY
jgi:hypothetical protein